MHADSLGVRAMFDGVARRYDILNTLGSLGLHKLWRRSALRFCPAAGRALDLCTGTADWAISLDSRCRLVVGVDFSAPMLAVARLKKRCRHSTRLLMGNAMRLPFRDSSFDLVTIGFSLRNMPALLPFFTEAARVLKPGGRFVSLELTRPSWGPLRRLHRWYLLLVVPALGTISRRGAYCYLARSILDFPSPGTVAEVMGRAGFSQARYLPLTGGMATVHVGIIDH